MRVGMILVEKGKKERKSVKKKGQKKVFFWMIYTSIHPNYKFSGITLNRKTAT